MAEVYEHKELLNNIFIPVTHEQENAFFFSKVCKILKTQTLQTNEKESCKIYFDIFILYFIKSVGIPWYRYCVK